MKVRKTDIFLTCVFFVPWRGYRWIYVTIKFIIIKWITITIELLDAIFSKFTKIEYSNQILWRNIYFFYNARLSLFSRPTNCCFLAAAIMPTRLKSDAPPVNLLSTFRGRRSAVGISLTFSRCVFLHNSHKCVSRGRFRFYYARDCMEDINFFFFFWSVKRLYNHDVQLQFQQCPRMWLSLWFGILFS